MSKLIIAEKPSVAKSIASTLGASSRADGFYEGSGLIVSWCVGHLVSPLDAGGYDERFKKWRYEDLPILPEPFRYAPIPGKEAALDNVKRLMAREDVTEIVNACDAGREGELIFRLVYELSGCRKPILRLWISSMEDSAIREGFSELRPGADYEALYQSALCRQKADWLVGINATRLFSVLYHRTLNVGRVQTPTLAMLAERDAKITLFHKEKYHLLRLTLDGVEAVSEKFTDPAEAEQAAAMCKGAVATCTSVTKEQKEEQPPKLYDLTTLQREANRLFGYTAKQTLDYAQSLYEKKLLTYPRTDSRYLTSDMAETASCVIHLAAKLPPFDGCTNFFPLVEAMISDKDVSDHHAIIPTMEVEKADIKALPLGERNLFLLVCCKLLCASAEPYMYEVVTATFDCSGQSFTAKGKRILSEGWREIDRIFRTFLKEKPEDGDGGTLPDFTEGQTFDGAEVAVTEHFTQPPKPYTEDTLLSAMEHAGKDDIPDEAERKGLGTPATRAAIIETLFKRNYIRKERKSLFPTATGTELIHVIQEELLKSAELTGLWEKKLRQIEKGSYEARTFLEELKQMVNQIVINVLSDQSGRSITIEQKKAEEEKPKKSKAASASKEAGEKRPRKPRKKAVPAPAVCPICHKGTLLRGKTAYGCSEYKNGCTFRLDYATYGADLTDEQLAQIANDISNQ